MAVVTCSATGCLYFSFMLLISFGRAQVARVVQPGLSVAMICGVAVIVLTWGITWGYVLWAERLWHGRVGRLREGAA
jgi:uncharacterized membrane protein (DUF485 family)